MDALTAIMTRRSTRNFSDAPLPESLMRFGRVDSVEANLVLGGGDGGRSVTRDA